MTILSAAPPRFRAPAPRSGSWWQWGLIGVLAGVLSLWLGISSGMVDVRGVGDCGQLVGIRTAGRGSTSKNFKSKAAQEMLPGLQRRPAQAALETWWGLDVAPPRSPGLLPSNLLSIPRIIHHVYIPDLAAYQRLSKDLTSHTRQRWGLSCVVQHPGWDYVFWDLASATQLVEKYYPGFADMWRGMNGTVINRANTIRYFILHAFGGLYLDLDIECWRGGEPWLLNADVVLQGTGQGATNGVMAGVAGHPVWEAAIQRVHSNWQRDPKMAGGQAGLTGPAMVKAVLNSFDGIRASKPGGSLAGRHSVAGSTVVVQPLGEWFMPCLHNDAACHQKVARERALGVAPLMQLAGYHRYSASWLAGGNSAGIHSMDGLTATLCKGQEQQGQPSKKAGAR